MWVTKRASSSTVNENNELAKFSCISDISYTVGVSYIGSVNSKFHRNINADVEA
jgi:hypothetical protein